MGLQGLEDVPDSVLLDELARRQQNNLRHVPTELIEIELIRRAIDCEKSYFEQVKRM